MFTSVHSEFIGTCDYIWFSSEAPVSCDTSRGHNFNSNGVCGGQRDITGSIGSSSGNSNSSSSGNSSASGRGNSNGSGKAPQHAASEPAVDVPGEAGSHHGSGAGGSFSSKGGDGERRPRLVPLAVLAPPHIGVLRNGLPAPQWGSDHVSLLCEFALECPCQTSQAPGSGPVGA